MPWLAYAAFGWRKFEVAQEIAIQTDLGWMYNNKLYQPWSFAYDSGLKFSAEVFGANYRVRV